MWQKCNKRDKHLYLHKLNEIFDVFQVISTLSHNKQLVPLWLSVGAVSLRGLKGAAPRRSVAALRSFCPSVFAVVHSHTHIHTHIRRE